MYCMYFTYKKGGKVTAKKNLLGEFFMRVSSVTGLVSTFPVFLVKLEEQQRNMYKIRRIRMSCNGETRTFHQLHYEAWPDHGTPTAINPILEMIAFARTVQPTDDTPMVIHCRCVYAILFFKARSSLSLMLY